MFYPLFSLSDKDRSRIVIVENKNDADYWLTNHYHDKQTYAEEFFKKYKLLNEITVDEVVINSVFKKIKQ